MGAQGTATVDFGAFPGTTDTTTVITGQTSISSGSLVEAWLWPVDTSDHLADEHWLDGPFVFAGNVVAGVGFTIYARTREPPGDIPDRQQEYDNVTAGTSRLGTNQMPTRADANPMLWGQWTVAWVWN